jgi:hypothetical protein
MSSIQKIKELYPLRETVARLIPDRLAHHGAHADLYYCPFHDDVLNPSFMVKNQWCSCQTTSCTINGKLWGDVVDFLLELFHVTKVWQLMEKLNMQLPDPPPRTTPVAKDEPEHNLLTWDHVKRGTRHQELAIPFFVGRGVKEPTIHTKWLGLYPSHPNKIRIDGTEHEFRTRRYTIPDIAFGQVRKIELRLDQSRAREDLALLDPNLVAKVATKLEGKLGKFPTDNQLTEVFFGGRYTRVGGGIKKELIFNVERLVQRITYEGTQGFFTPDLPYVLVHEGAFKALAMEDACDDAAFGYPSISCHAAGGLAAATAGVKEVIIVQDLDTDKVRPDGVIVNPGRDYAQRALEATGRRYGVRIITPPEGFNGADDVVKGGVVHEWMSKNGIEPIKLRR